jgi:hypothetical protein
VNRLKRSPYKKWNELTSLLFRIQSNIPPFARPPLSIENLLKTPPDEREAILKTGYGPLASKTETALVSWIRGEDGAELTSEEGHLALTILRYAHRFIGHIPADDARKTVLAFPTGPIQEVAHYLVTEWWREFGWNLFATEVQTLRDDLVRNMF